ncbi:MAG: redoxin domain-containing protein [Planctomycetaceae bacterium]
MLVRILIVAAVVLSDQAAIRADGRSASPPDAIAEQYQTLIDEYEEDGEAREYAGRFISFARQHPKESVAVDALVWVVANVRRGRDLQEALTLLAQKYQHSERLAPVCRKLAFRPSPAAEKLLRVLRRKTPHINVRALATFYLAVYLQRQLSLAEALNREQDQNRFVQFYGREFTVQLARLDAQVSLREVELIYDEVRKSFSSIEIDDSTMGAAATRELFAIRHLSRGRKAPEITGQDIDGKTFRLSDYRGKVVMLDFWGHW